MEDAVAGKVVQEEVEWERPKVLLCTLCTQMVTTAMAHHTAMLCLEDGGKTIIGQQITHTARSYQGRNYAIAKFLDGPADVLLWIDSDMTFDLNTYYRLLDAQKDHRITTALAYIYTGEAIWPNIFYYNEEAKSYEIDFKYNPGSEFYVDATGVAFTMIHRSVYEELNELGLEGRWHEDHVEHYETGREMGHDISFFHEARTKLGVRPWYITSAKTGHVKVGVIDEGAFHAFISQVQGLPPAIELEKQT